MFCAGRGVHCRDATQELSLSSRYSPSGMRSRDGAVLCSRQACSRSCVSRSLRSTMCTSTTLLTSTGIPSSCVASKMAKPSPRLEASVARDMRLLYAPHSHANTNAPPPSAPAMSKNKTIIATCFPVSCFPVICFSTVFSQDPSRALGL